MKKVLVVHNIPDMGYSYYLPFKEFGPLTENDKELDKVGLVVFTGGSDVCPSLYGEEPHRMTYNKPMRDAYESAIFLDAYRLKIPMVGICRGAQFLCVMAGGKLIQHVDNHHSNHNIVTDDGRTIRVNSSHHQMQLPPEGSNTLAWCCPPRSSEYSTEPPPVEYECVYYPKINAVGVQYHPEAMLKDTEGFQYTVELTRKLLGKGFP